MKGKTIKKLKKFICCLLTAAMIIPSMPSVQVSAAQIGTLEPETELPEVEVPETEAAETELPKAEVSETKAAEAEAPQADAAEAEPQANTNLALNKTAVASSQEADSVRASNATDGDSTSRDSRWGSAYADAPHWIYVDLGKVMNVETVKIYWENRKATNYKIQVSSELSENMVDSDWKDVKTFNDHPASTTDVIVLDQVEQARYVRLYINSFTAADPDGGVEWNTVSIYEMEVYGGELPEEETQDPTENVALHKTAVASSQEADSVRASNATDGDSTSHNSRWGSNLGNGPHWIYVDLGEVLNVKTVKIFWENRKATEYKIQVSSELSENMADSDWKDVKTFSDRPASKTDVIVLDQVEQARYVRLLVNSFTEEGPDEGDVTWNTISIYEMEVYGGELSEEETQDPTENVALHKTAVASSQEADSVRASNATDGDHKSKNSRWGSNVGDGPHWIYVDLGKELDVKTVRIYWENRKATNYAVQVSSELSNPMNESDWTAIKTSNTRPTAINEKIVLEEAVKARYVRLLVNDFTEEDPDGGVTWNTVSIYEMEVYGGEPTEDEGDVLERISVQQPAKGDKKLTVVIPETEAYEITYNGTDYEQVVDSDLTIYEPVVDTEVKVSFKVVDKATNDYQFKEIPVTIPGTYQQEEGDNAAPVILPELREWKGHTGSFTVTDSARIVYAEDSLKDAAEAFANDYTDMTGKTIEAVKGTAAAGDFFLTLTTDTSKGLQDEGYLMTVGDTVEIEAETTTGAFWGTRTVLQALKAGDNTSIPKGIARDYPLYKIRGYILDVGRKTFTLDYLKQIVKEMSWYKLNDFQVHLNDNFIWLEEYTAAGKDPLTAYSGFRLESDIKKGGNNGLNQADLTSTDVFYTKDEFRSFIKEARVYGVDIVPEIDVPAHSLALTKVRPDLRHGTSGRDNDHLNLVTKYDESVEFVKSIFGEYMDGENPVFDADTIVHVGADEYTANGNAYRRFADEMLGYVQDSGRTARIWGSLSQIKGDVDVRSKDVQINLWNFGWANMDQMYEEGFDLINCNDGHYYIVPNAGYYYDYLSNNIMYNLAINSISGVTIPAGDKQMVGGAFAVWNDMTDYKNNGITEYDVYDRICDGLPLFAAKLWGKGSMNQAQAEAVAGQMGDAPNTNFGYEIAHKGNTYANYPMDDLTDASENGYDLSAGVNAEIVEVDCKNALKLNGSESYVNVNGIETAGLGNDLRVKVKRTDSGTEEQILFESSYGTIKAVQKDTGKVGFSRENLDFSFDYELPVNEWVELEFKNEQNRMTLYVNGELVDVLGDGETVAGRPLIATGMFPFARIGSQTNAFVGYVDDVRLTENGQFSSTMKLDQLVLQANTLLKNGSLTGEKKTQVENLVSQAEALFASAAPEGTAIDECYTALTEALKDVDYEKADYSRVEKYLSLVEDISWELFAEGSQEKIASVQETIREDLPVEMQTTVDGYETMLVNALQSLEMREMDDLYYVDNSTVKVTASSQETASENTPAANAVDGNTGTFWHSRYSSSAPTPHQLTLELAKEEMVDGYYYLPRQSGSNGHITKYKIEVSTDGNAYTQVAEGTWGNNAQAKTAEFTPVQAKFVRLTVVESVGGFASAAEVKIHKQVTPDKDGLQTVISEAKAFDVSLFSQATQDVYSDAIKAAEAVVGNADADANAVETAKMNILQARVQLLLDDKVIPELDLTEIREKIQEAKALKEADYTTATWTELRSALADAEAVAADENASQKEIDDAAAKLAEAIKNLEKAGTDKPTEPDTTVIEEKIEEAEGLKEKDYTAATWTELRNALAHAKDVFANKDASQEEIDAAAEKLAEAIKNLEKAGTDKPTEPDTTVIEETIKEAEGLKEKDYTAATWTELKNALTHAKTVLADKNASQKEIDDAAAKLAKAIGDLKKADTDKPVEPDKPAKPDKPTEVIKPSGSDKTNNSGNSTASNQSAKPAQSNPSKTADTAMIEMYVLLLAAGFVGMIALKKKRHI